MDNRNEIVKLAVDAYTGKVAGNFSQNDSMEVLRQAFVDANNGSTKLDLKAIRDGKCVGMFAILEEILQKLVVEGLRGDEFFLKMVDYRNLKLGDLNEFTVPDNSLFTVSDIAEGINGFRRQRLNGATTTKVNTQLKGVKIYEELNRVLSGRIDFNEFITRVAKSFKNKVNSDIYTAFRGSFSSLPATFAKSGTYAESTLLELVEHVEAATDQTATIVGTKTALRKISTAVPTASLADAGKEDLYNIGYYGKFYSTPMIAMKNVHIQGTYNFMLQDEVYVIAGDSMPIKHVTEGESMILMGDPMTNQLLQQEFLYTDRYGVGCAISEIFGQYRLS